MASNQKKKGTSKTKYAEWRCMAKNKSVWRSINIERGAWGGGGGGEGGRRPHPWPRTGAWRIGSSKRQFPLSFSIKVYLAVSNRECAERSCPLIKNFLYAGHFNGLSIKERKVNIEKFFFDLVRFFFYLKKNIWNSVSLWSWHWDVRFIQMVTNTYTIKTSVFFFPSR